MVTMSLSSKGKDKYEAGFASIVVALVLVTVLSLITLGFAQITRREQQNALNDHLALQANYAAESRINELVNSPLVSNDTSCTGDTKSIGQSVSISCVLVNISPKDILFNNVQSASGRAMMIETTSAVSKIKISWSSNTGAGSNLRTNLSNPAASQWSSPGLVQMNVTPLNAIDRNSLVNNTFSTFLYPMTNAAGSGNNLSATPANYGSKYGVKCVATNPNCTVTIDSLPSTSKFLIHFIVYYDTNTTLSISPIDGSGNSVTTTNTQAEIDVTAKAQDVLKRLRVRTPIGVNKNASFALPDYALEAGNICKRIAITDNLGIVTAAFKDTDLTNPDPNTACDLLTDN